MSDLLAVEGLVTTFPGRTPGARVPVVDRVDLRVARGETLALVGESGCGKSMTALSILSLVQKPDRIEAGSIWLDGRELRGLPATALRQVRGARIAMIFQEPATSLNPVQRVGAQVMEAVALHERVSAADARRRARALFEAVGIPDPEARLGVYPHQLSGGLKQRVMIAIALAGRPEVLIADEPTTALDVTVQAQILALLRALSADTGAAVLLITHDLGVVNEVADRVAVMYAGRVVEEGPRMAVLATPRHPYTQGLLRSIPSRALPGERLAEIPGSVPAADAWPPGCRFAPRCAIAMDVCRVCEPDATLLAEGASARCHALVKP